MAVHKVPQDVEADDKFLGPLSFKQFLFFGGALILGYFIFLTAQNGLWPLSAIIFIPFVGLTALSIPWSKEQPTEIYLAARLRFYLKPRRRIWNQTGMSDLVTVTAPIRQIHAMTDGLNQTEVRSRFNALATMIDSRGWAVKNYTSVANIQDDESDRLVQGTTAEPTALDMIASTTDDVLDEKSSVVAKQFDSMIQQSETKHKSETQRLIEEARQSSMKAPQQTAAETPVKQNMPTPKTANPKNNINNNNENFWFMHQNNQQVVDPNLTTFSAAPIITPGATSQAQPTPQIPVADPKASQIDESSVLETIHEKQQRDKLQTGSTHGKVLNPIDNNSSSNSSPAVTTSTPVVNADEPTLPAPQENKPQAQKNPDILNLARNNDLNISTIAKEANKSNSDDGEVVISLR